MVNPPKRPLRRLSDNGVAERFSDLRKQRDATAHELDTITEEIASVSDYPASTHDVLTYHRARMYHLFEAQESLDVELSQTWSELARRASGAPRHSTTHPSGAPTRHG